ncbi:MAG: stage II sporulation protein M [Comamonadaceae bacterium]|nr:stage II sporulation protein M [Comamonadaceae bacterium]
MDRQYSSVLVGQPAPAGCWRRISAVYGERRRDGRRGAALRAARIARRWCGSEWRVVTVAAALLFFVPLLALLGNPAASSRWRYYPVLSPEYVGQVEEMYDAERAAPGAARGGAASEWMMWGFYIANNVRIDFQCFAGGIAFGLGSVFFLAYNGHGHRRGDGTSDPARLHRDLLGFRCRTQQLRAHRRRPVRGGGPAHRHGVGGAGSTPAACRRCSRKTAASPCACSTERRA